ncbi:MAG: hypothetical protein IJF17_11870 [Thermoguttaceae bacterium]|nr:hypothetical protein [Thermoguttaceae bacterium]
MFTLISFAAVAYVIWKHDTIAGAMRSGRSPREHLEHEAKRKQELREYARELKLERKRMKERELGISKTAYDIGCLVLLVITSLVIIIVFPPWN